MLYFSSVAEHILCFRNYSTIFLTIISHRNDFGTQVQWHFLSDGGWGEVGPGSKMSRDHKRQMVPCEPPGKGQKTALGKTDTEKRNTAPRDPRKKAQECGWRTGGIGAGVRHEVTHFVSREIYQPNTLYVLKTRSLYQITSPNGASCTNLLNPNIEGFFFLSTLRVPWTARRSNQSILKEISPER